MAFQGQGWVLVQPSEGRIVPAAGGGGGGLLGQLSAAELGVTGARATARAPLHFLKSCALDWYFAWLQRPSTTA